MSALKRVLVCDDSLTIRRLVAMVAQNLGIELDLAVNAAEGVAKAQAGRPELILLDFVLPDGKGNDVLDRLAQSDVTASIPVVMMSAKGESLVDQLGHRPSVVGFLNKPFKPQDLEALLLAQVGRTAARHGHAATEPGSHAAPASMVSQAAEGVLARLDDQAFAKLLFRVLRGELTATAEHITKKGVPTDAAELAKRLIKPSVIRELRTEIEAACPNRRRAATGTLEVLRPMVPERTPGFSARVVGTPLRDPERRLLGLVDGNRTLGEIERELQTSAAEVAGLFDTVAGLGLVRLRSALLGGNRGAMLWLVDDLPGDFPGDLAQHLARFGRRWTLMRLRGGELADEAGRALPDGIIVRSTSPEVVANVRSIAPLERVPLAAVFDDSQLVASALLGAGADMAWPLPVRTAAIDSFLGLSCSA